MSLKSKKTGILLTVFFVYSCYAARIRESRIDIIKFKSLSDLKSMDEFKIIFSQKYQSNTIIIGEEAPWYLLPSGPSVFIYDKSDELLEYSKDIGQDKRILGRHPEVLESLKNLSLGLE